MSYAELIAVWLAMWVAIIELDAKQVCLEGDSNSAISSIANHSLRGGQKPHILQDVHN